MTEPIIPPASTTLVLSKDDIMALQREKPKMPQIATPVDLASVIRAVSQIKEVLETRNGNRGSKLDAGITWRDMLSNGLAQVNMNGKSYAARPDPGGGNVVPVGPQNDVTIPPAPTGLRLMGAITNVIAAWDRPNFRNYAYTEVWRSATDNLGEAVMIAQTPAFVYADSIGSGTGFFYWVRFVSTANIAGPFNRQAGSYGQTGYDASYLLDVLAANPPAGVNYNPLLYVQDNPNLVIDGQPIPVGVYMNTAYMRALSVTNAMIANLAVDNAKIVNLDAVKITAGDIDADRMRANIVEAAVGRFNTLSALSASLGQVQIDSDGWLRTAGVASYITGNGIWMGYDAGIYKLRIGNPAGQHITWDGSQLNITGNLYSTGNGTFRGTFIAGNAESLYPPGGQDGLYAGNDGFFVGRGYTALGTAPNSEAFFRMDRAARSIVTYAQDVTIINGWPSTKSAMYSDGNASFQHLSVDRLTVRNPEAPGGVRRTLGLSSNTSDPVVAPSTQVQFYLALETDVVMYMRARGPNAGHGYACITNYAPATSLEIYNVASGGSYEQGYNGAFLTSAADAGGGMMLATRLPAGTYWFNFVLLVPNTATGPTDMSACLKSLL